MGKIRNEQLEKNLLEAIKGSRKVHLQTVADLREQAYMVDASLQLLEGLDLDWFGTTRLYVRVTGKTKAHFSDAVERIAKALGEVPDVQVNPGMFSRSEYVAEFKTCRVHVFLADPSDCKLIEEEVTETRKVLRPHPACIAALQSLEQAG